MSKWQAQTGTLSSTPKLTSIKGDDNMALVYRNMGNNHSYPFIWSETVTVANGTDTLVLASGVKFHGMDISSAKVSATPIEDTGAVRVWVEKDTVTNKVSIKASGNVGTDVDFDVLYMLGADADISSIYCRGNTGAQQSLP